MYNVSIGCLERMTKFQTDYIKKEAEYYENYPGRRVCRNRF